MLASLRRKLRHAAWLSGLALCIVCLSSGSSVSRAENAVDAQAEVKLEAQTSILWPVLPGESVAQLASRFYPNNKSLQQHFVDSTLALNQLQNTGLQAAQVFEQVALIQIPALKSPTAIASPSSTISEAGNPPTDLSSSKAMLGRLHLSYQLKYLAEHINQKSVPSALRNEYEQMLQRDQNLQQQLQSENERIESLQKNLEQVLPKVKAALAEDNAKSAATPTVLQKPVVKQPQFNVKLAWYSFFGAVLSLLVLLWGAKRQRERKFARLSGLNTFIYDTLIQDNASPAQVIQSDSDKDRSEQVNLTSTIAGSDLNSDSTASGNGADTDSLALKQGSTIEEDEAESVIASATLLMGAGKPKQAQVLLQAYLQQQPQHSVYPWLYLLDIYRNLNQKTEFLALVARLHDNFNVVLPQWEETESHIVLPSTLEAFPHIMKQLQSLWPSELAAAYLKSLMLDRREGERVGFSLQVMQEIALLQQVLDVRDEFSAQ